MSVSPQQQSMDFDSDIVLPAAPSIAMPSAWQRAEKAIERVTENADHQWIEDAYDAMLKLAKQRREFMAEDIWPFVGYVPREKRAMAAVIQKAKRNHIIVGSGRYEYTKATTCNPHPRQVWLSQIYGN